MKYKVGDKVRIKSKAYIVGNLHRVGVVEAMLDYANKEAIIVSVGLKGENGYKINADNKEWWWFEDMFEDLPQRIEEKPTISEQMVKDIAYVIKKHNLGVCVSENDGKLIIEPLNDKDEDLPIDTPVMCSCSMKGELAWFVRFYAGSRKTWWDLGKSYNEKRKVDWACIIPFDKFNPNDIDESLKYNIVK